MHTKDGVHLCSIGHDMEELKGPWGLCVHGQYVYVTDVTSHCVLCSPLMVNMSPHLVRKKTYTILITFMLIVIVSLCDTFQ